MSRRKGQDLAPSLFPFLAVLVCTLGTLILLLALLAENSATAAEQRAREAATEKLKQIQTDPGRPTAGEATALIDETKFHIESIESIRDKQAAALEERRDQLTHLENHIGRLTKELRQLNAEIENATGDVQQEQITSATIAMLRDQIAEEELVIEQLKRDTGNLTPRVVIVPHKGPNGTTRRPIYVECTAEGLTIWPEEVKITVNQLSGRGSRLANPLDAALRVARLHIMQVYGDADPPYPLLVVRPHGTDAYFLATAAMDDWDDQYGYEMLDSDIKLSFDAPDPNLKRRMEQSIAAALARKTDRRTPRAVPLSASDMARKGRSMGFHERPNHGYAGGGGNGDVDMEHQANRLEDIYRQAAQELRARDGGDRSSTSASSEIDDQESDAEIGTVDQSLTGNDTEGPNGQPDAIQSGASQPAGSSPESIGSPTSGTAVAEQQPNDQRDPNNQTPAAAMVHRDGQDWALPANVARATGIAIVRPIRVQLYADRFVVPATRGENAKVIPIDGNIDRASLQLASVLRDRIARWGVALDNGRWEPRLEFELIDGTSRQVSQLQRLFDGSGIEVIQRPLP